MWNYFLIDSEILEFRDCFMYGGGRIYVGVRPQTIAEARN